MKKIVLYTTQTGNTRKIAHAIADEIGAKAVDFANADDIDMSEIDFVAIGYYIDKSAINMDFVSFVHEKIKNKKIGIFFTMGAEPCGEYADKMLKMGRETFAQNGNEILVEFASQGAISTEVIAQMTALAKLYPNDPRFAITPERQARWQASQSHPNATDIQNAKKAFGVINFTQNNI